MLSGAFVAEITDDRKIELPSEMANRLHLVEGDRVEVLVKRIRSRRLDIKISRNPLMKLLELNKEA